MPDTPEEPEEQPEPAPIAPTRPADRPALLTRWRRAITRQFIADTQDPNRILIVLELTGGNDGLNTVVPYADPAYYRARPTLGIPAARVLKLDDHFGLPTPADGWTSRPAAGSCF